MVKRLKNILHKDWVGIILSFCLVGGLWWLLLNTTQSKSDDTVNTVNSFFSAMAFAGVIIAIYLQRHELRLQRDELKSTRAEFEIQNQTLKKQRFENTFFNLINLHHQIAGSLYLYDSGFEYKGRAVIKQAYLVFSGSYIQEVAKQPLPLMKLEDVQPFRSQISQVFNATYRSYDEHLSHYLKNFTTLVNFVKQSDLIHEKERKDYYSIIKSQINTFEILLLFYYYNVGLGSADKVLFDDLVLGALLNTSLLPSISHSYIFDPDWVIQNALA